MKAKYLPLLFLLLAFCNVTAQEKNKRARQDTSALPKPDLSVYKGLYTSAEYPDGIIIDTLEGKLTGKLPKQGVITFDHTAKNRFTSEKEGISLDFSSDKKQLALQRKEGTILLVRKTI